MHLFKKVLLCLFVLQSLLTKANNLNETYPETGVQLHVKGSLQPDSVGFNIIYELNRILFPGILDGSIPLWQSQEKKRRIKPKDIENQLISLQLPYHKIDDYYFYEKWTLQNGKFEFEIHGFALYYFDPIGKSHSLGYLALKDIEQILKGKWIKVNPNGSIGTRFWEALYSKKYHFEIIQFGNKWIANNPVVKRKIYKDALGNNKISHLSKITLAKQKSIQYTIFNTKMKGFEENQKFFDALEHFLNQNKQIFLNKSQIFRKMSIEEVYRLKPIVKYAEIVEIVRLENKQIISSAKQINLRINNETVSFKGLDIKPFDFSINFVPFQDFLKKKKFAYTITQINGNEINLLHAKNYKNRINLLKWNTITYEQSL